MILIGLLLLGSVISFRAQSKETVETNVLASEKKKDKNNLTTGNHADSSQVPRLMSPEKNEILDNGCRREVRQSCTERVFWRFEWTFIPNASEYELYVISEPKGPRDKRFLRAKTQPLIRRKLKTNFYEFKNNGVVVWGNNYLWSWKVRAKFNGMWTTWSETRNFIVEQDCLDCKNSQF